MSNLLPEDRQQENQTTNALKGERIFYTILSDKHEVRLNITNTDSGKIELELPQKVSIDQSQLLEIGCLCLFFAFKSNSNFDPNSVLELLSGYGMTDQENQNFIDRLSSFGKLLNDELV